MRETGGEGAAFQDVGGLVPGYRYEITAWALSATGTTAKASLWVHDTAEGNGARDGFRTPDSKHWERFSVQFLGSQTGKVRIHLNHDGGREAIYWDDAVIRQIQ